jgi:hypothetical protein
MRIVHKLAALTIGPVLKGACEAAGIDLVGTADTFLLERFVDRSQRLTRALEEATERAWQALELTLVGDSWWDRCRLRLAPGDYQAVRAQVQAFLAVTPLAVLPGHPPEFREQCLRELRAARKAGLLTGQRLDPKEIAAQAGPLVRFDPTAALAAERQALDQLADDLRQAHYPTLAHLIALRPDDPGSPLLVLAARSFFRREVETDSRLAQGLVGACLERFGDDQERGFAALADGLARLLERCPPAAPDGRPADLAEVLDRLPVEWRKQAGRDDTVPVARLADRDKPRDAIPIALPIVTPLAMKAVLVAETVGGPVPADGIRARPVPGSYPVAIPVRPRRRKKKGTAGPPCLGLIAGGVAFVLVFSVILAVILRLSFGSSSPPIASRSPADQPGQAIVGAPIEKTLDNSPPPATSRQREAEPSKEEKRDNPPPAVDSPEPSAQPPNAESRGDLPTSWDSRHMGVAEAMVGMELRPRRSPQSAQPPGEEGADVEPPPIERIFARGPRVFLADLREFGVVAGGPWPFGKNGKVGDGRPITVKGVRSHHGLSMHPPWAPKFSRVRYRLGKQATRFKATAAINDSSNWCWSPATFTVWGDGRKLWQSKPLAHTMDRSDECVVDVSGVDVLELRVQVLNGSDGDHAVWFEPRLLQRADTPDRDPPPVVFAHGPRAYLSDLEELSTRNGPWMFSTNGVIAPEKKPIEVNGVRSPKGLGMHPPDAPGYANVTYRLDRQAALFKGAVALNDTATFIWSKAVFEVYGDGKRLWRSDPVNRARVLQEFRIPVGTVDVLELRVSSQGSHMGLHAVWLEPRLLQKADTPDSSAREEK